MTVNYVRAKLKTLLANVEMRQKCARKGGETDIPTPRTSLLDNLSAAQLKKISKDTSTFFCDFPDLIKFFEPLPVEVDDFDMYVARLRSSIAREIEERNASLPAAWEQELTGKRPRVLYNVLDDEPPPPPEHRPIPPYDPKDAWPCHRAQRGLFNESTVADRMRACVVRERRAMTEEAANLQEGFRVKIQKNEFKVRQQKEAEKEGRKRLQMKKVITELTAKNCITLMDADAKYFEQAAEDHKQNLIAAVENKDKELEAVIARNARKNARWKERAEIAKKKVERDIEAIQEKGREALRRKQERFDEIMKEQQLESSPHIVDKRNLALKHKIVHHNKKEAEKAEETLRTEGHLRKDAVLAAAARRRELDRVFPNRVRLRAATIRGGESFTIPEHNFATRVFGDTSTSEDLHRWSSAPCFSRKEPRWETEFPPGAAAALLDARSTIEKAKNLVEAQEHFRRKVEQSKIYQELQKKVKKELAAMPKPV